MADLGGAELDGAAADQRTNVAGRIRLAGRWRPTATCA